MKAVAAAVLFACAVAGPLQAKTFGLPDANPGVSVTLPDKWKPTEVDKGVEATSPDQETYVAFETATAAKMEALIDEDIAFLRKSGVEIDRSSQQTQDTVINGIKVAMLHWTGKDKDGPTAVTLGIFGLTDNLVMLMTAWSSPAGDKAHGDELTAMLSSVTRR